MAGMIALELIMVRERAFMSSTLKFKGNGEVELVISMDTSIVPQKKQIQRITTTPDQVNYGSCRFVPMRIPAILSRYADPGLMSLTNAFRPSSSVTHSLVTAIRCLSLADPISQVPCLPFPRSSER